MPRGQTATLACVFATPVHARTARNRPRRDKIVERAREVRCPRIQCAPIERRDGRFGRRFDERANRSRGMCRNSSRSAPHSANPTRAGGPGEKAWPDVRSEVLPMCSRRHECARSLTACIRKPSGGCKIMAAGKTCLTQSAAPNCCPAPVADSVGGWPSRSTAMHRWS